MIVITGSVGESNSGFLEYLTHPGASILDMQVVELLGERYGTPGSYLTPAPALVVQAPFLVEWIHQRHLTVRIYPVSWRTVLS